MKRINSAILCLLILAFGSDLVAQHERERELREGSLDRVRGEVELEMGSREKRERETRFSNFEQLASQLRAREYTEAGLDRLKVILTNSYQGGDDISTAQPTDRDAIIEVTEEIPRVKFLISPIVSNNFGTFDQALKDTKGQTGCERISTSCVRCPDGKKYCYIKNMMKPLASADFRR